MELCLAYMDKTRKIKKQIAEDNIQKYMKAIEEEVNNVSMPFVGMPLSNSLHADISVISELQRLITEQLIYSTNPKLYLDSEELNNVIMLDGEISI